MAQPTLKSILGKRSEITAWLKSWTENTGTSITVEDNQHNPLFCTENSPENEPAYPVLLEDETMGWVKGKGEANIMANLLSLMLQKEADKKKLGSEVLNLYQELNVIYNFS